MSNLTLARLLADDMEGQADWRQRKAEEYPDDKQRNLDCAAQFLDLAARLRKFRGGSWYERYCLLVDDENLKFRMSEQRQLMTGTIHFVAEEAEGFFEKPVANASDDPLNWP